jgi:predicted amidohydrolase
MRIRVIQLPVTSNGTMPYPLSDYLANSGNSDLTIFPELFPFGDADNIINNIDAIVKLENFTRDFSNCTFIAGGYVVERKRYTRRHIYRNRAYLVHRGFVIDYYDKQATADEEKFILPGEIVKTFSWAGHKCIPLICADAYENCNSRFTRRIVNLINIAGASADVPIVICSYSIPLTTKRWKRNLHYLANQCGASLVIAGIAGKDEKTKPFKEPGGRCYHYGGGGSGLFRAGDVNPWQFLEPGIVSIDTSVGTAEHGTFLDVPARQ